MLNLIWQFGDFTSLPNLMYANANYNMSVIQAIYTNVTLFTKLKVRQVAFMFHFAKLYVRQIYHVYGIWNKLIF